MKILFLLLISILLTSCPHETLPSLLNLLDKSDRIIPTLLEYEVLDKEHIKVTFSESVELTTVEVDANTASYKLLQNSTYLISSPHKLSISKESELFMVAKDESGNSSSFILPLYGLNDRIPTLLINEFSSRKSDTQPERIELLVLLDGNTEGVYLSDGAKGYENYGFSMPNLEVQRGDLIVIYWEAKPKENKYKNRSGTMTYNIYASSPTSLADNNGAFVLYKNKNGKADIIDALLYSDFNSTTYSGFGSAKVESSANILKEEYEWFSEAFNCNSSTTTRTINRNISGTDTNRKEDFYICATREQSFGEYNNGKEYIEGEK